MNTVTTLTYWETPHNATTPPLSLSQPLLFNKRQSAVTHLVSLCISMALGKGDDYLKEYIDTLVGLGFRKDYSIEAFCSDMRGCTEDVGLAFIDWYFDFANDDLVSAGYTLNCTPTHSFIESVNLTDSFNLNGSYTATFNVNAKAILGHDLFLTLSIINANGVQSHWKITLDEAHNAEYSPEDNCWMFNDTDLRLYTHHYI